ncbi:MAG TPA: SusD/RagB family nutrient-binding outer membrane lipoprotein [Gemmatimonadaceae bacterium]|nr:SusD/RagB family nutrient-binding outer membrane lipoprotein [Gemmatimonadaceae bacterium]
MRTLSRVALAAMLPALLVAGCDDWLTGPKLTTDPNRPVEADRNQLFTGVQAQLFIQQTGEMARLTSMWTQQMAGTDRQYASQALYSYTEDDFSTYWDDVYGGGGLIDLRLIQSLSDTAGDRVYSGIAKVLEAYIIGTAASIFGDIPYSQALESDTPELDEQLDVYAAMQTLLDDAIADLTSGEGSGPGAVDLIYGGDAAAWTEAAWTLKARYYLHTAEVDASAYGQALSAAQNGISSPANDFETFQTDVTLESNIWYQFFRDRDSYIRAGKTLVDTLVARGDPRLTEYFGPAGNGSIGGAAQGAAYDPVTQSPLSATRGAPGFDQPLITWEENQLIIAEAAYHTGAPGVAQGALNAVRTANSLGSISPSGGALLHAIMIEKWIVMFQNIEAYSDYRRTCAPNLAPAGGATSIPGRVLYAFTERNTNPNVPPPSEQPARNDNDPVTPTSPTGQACLGQS